MTRLAAFTALMALGACAMPPEGVDEAAVARFDNAVLSMGCKLVTEPHYVAAEFQTGLSRETLIETIQYKIALEQAEPLEEGGFRFKTQGCGDAA